jgi:hypothetical protein
MLARINESLPVEPQSSGKEQRHYCDGETIDFHGSLLFRVKLRIHLRRIIRRRD